MTADRITEITLFALLLGGMLALGYNAARWRRPKTVDALEEWGVGGRAFGNWVTWFLLGGSMYTAYTYIAVPAVVYGTGAIGFFAVPFAVVCGPLMYFLSTRTWSVSHAHGFVTSAEFVRARFGSRTLGALVALTGIAATMPYIAVQLVALKATFATIGFSGEWPLLVAVTVASVTTFKSGLRAPTLLSILKDLLLVWLVLMMLAMIALTGGFQSAFTTANQRYATDASAVSNLLLPENAYLGYLSLAVGSALAVFVYPHAVTVILAAKDRTAIKHNAAASPVYCLALGLFALLGVYAIGQGVVPHDGDVNTITPQVFHDVFPKWIAGIAYATIAVAALIPAAVMSIAAANLFTRCVYREYLRPDATPAEETRVSRYLSLLAKVGAALFIVLLDPAFSIDLQLIGGVLILQTVPAALLGLYTAWPHRAALIAGLLTGLGSGLLMLYLIPQRAADGHVLKAHFGGSSWPLRWLGLDSAASVYVGLLALAVNLGVAVGLTVVLRAIGVPGGRDATRPDDYFADAGDEDFQRLGDLVDGRHPAPVGAHFRIKERSFLTDRS
ncbi:sodium:solute symporter [Hamadaea sp. NPDC051192]|uniref:sodium:solute symporter family protein n=1 Tax=Hamadaea sp. NPDC051192 TaxID=3154940 RepID=UPI00341FEA10